MNSVWRVETTSLTYYAASSSDLGHINFLVNSLIIISITAPPQINITSLINADMCDLLRWVMEECLDLILLKLISLFFCLFENTFSLESRIQAEWVLVGVLTHSVTSRCQAIAPRRGKKKAWWNKCWLLTPPISWQSSLSPQAPLHRLRYLQTVISHKCLSVPMPPPRKSESARLWLLHVHGRWVY